MKKTRNNETQDSDHEQAELEQYISELYRENIPLKSQRAIVDAIRSRFGKKYSQSSVSRALQKMGAKKTNEGWNLEINLQHERNLADLRRFFKRSIDDDTNLIKDYQIYTLKTKPSRNSLLAKKIRDTFNQVVIFTLCPNETDIIIFYGGSNCKNDSKSHDRNEFEETILQCLNLED